ncbi:class II aldolase/adducin family protein [Planctomicrobium sp. SH661]|uniref:class II aldolase/adducin family protein n=1 Tax=Planctomicrobium sp. SH661 TaxID=3448124 RepID=UPI003F5B13A8
MYHPLFNNPEIKEWICEIGRRVYNKGFAAANDGNISYRVGENEVLCSPTMICKGFMKHEDICMVDIDGKQLAGTKKRTSEILLHLTIMKHRPDVKAVVHCHPPHATAFAVSREAIPQCVLPEIEVFMGEVPLAPYETPGAQGFADTVVPFLKSSNTIILTNHGTVTFGKTLEEAYWKTEILDAYCRILILSKQLGGITYLNEQKSRELLDLKKRLGFDDPRFHLEDCDLCGNTAFQEGYKSVNAPQPQTVAFDPPPKFPGYLKSASNSVGADPELLVKAITDEVLAALRSK